MSHLHIAVHILDGSIFDPDPKLVYMGKLRNPVPHIKIGKGGSQPLYFLQPVMIGWGGQGSIVMEPT